MPEEVEVLFNYKGKDVLVKRKRDKFYIGIRGNIDVWFENTPYNTIALIKTSGREYARIIIDKMLLARRNSCQLLINKL